MEWFRCLFEDFRRALGLAPRVELSDFQKAKLLHEFRTFYDVNKDGRLQWKDFEMVKEYICSKSGWKVNSPQWQRCRELFIELWRNLQDTGDENTDGDITSEEWIVLWKKIYAAKVEHSRSARRLPPGSLNEDVPSSDESESLVDQEYIPNWFRKYIEYKFYLLDRAGDGVIDGDEFEYALGDFDIPPNDCRTAFRLMSLNGQRKIDMAYFRELALQFYLSNDPSDLGNFINGKLSYD